MSEHSCGVAFDATVPEVALDLSLYCAENFGDSAVAVYQHRRRLPCGIPQLPCIWWSISLLCSTTSLSWRRGRFPRSRLLCGPLSVHSCSWTRLSMPLLCRSCRSSKSVSWRRGFFTWSCGPSRFPSCTWTWCSTSLCCRWCEFHRCRRGEDSRAPTIALVEKLVAFPSREFGHCLGPLIIAVMS